MDLDAHAAQAESAITSVLDALLDFEVAERTATAGLAKRFALNHSELTALALLARNGSQQVTRLAALLQLTAGSTSSLVTRLSERDLVHRRRSDHDRRSVELTLTEAGMSVVQAMYERFRAAVQAALSGATNECLVTTSGVLRATAAELSQDPPAATSSPAPARTPFPTGRH